MKTIHLHDPALSVKENKLILDNSQTIRNEILKFESSDDFYFISVMWRRKDHPECPANENARMLANWCIKNIEYFDSHLPLIKDYCEHFGARAYIKPQVRSCKATNREILKFMANQIDNFDLAYSTLTREIISGYHCSRDKRIILDLDTTDESYMHQIFNEVYHQFEKEGRQKEADKYLLWLPTFNGYHIISPGFDPRCLQKFNLPKDTWHSDNDTILYAVKNCEPDTIYEY